MINPKGTCTTELRLWCVLCTPVYKRNDEAVKRDLSMLLAGPKKGDEMSAMLWTCKAMCGIEDHRQAHHATSRNRLLVFRTKRAADKYARKEQKKNNRWKFTVNPVRLNSPDKSDVKEYETEISKAGMWSWKKFSETHNEIVGKVFTPSEGEKSEREEVVGVAPSVPFNEAKRIVDAHNQEIKNLIAEMTMRSYFGG